MELLLSSSGALVTMFRDLEIVDLSHRMQTGMPTFPTHPKYFIAPYPGMGDPAEFNQLIMSDHSGTHVDAPAHFVPPGSDTGRVFTDQLDPATLIGRLITIPLGPFDAVSHAIEPTAVTDWEAEHTTIEPGDIVIFNTRWGRENWAEIPGGFDYLRGWPGLTGDTAVLLRERGVSAVGIDCISIDPGDRAGDDLRAHYELLPHGVLVMENLTNLDALPPVSFLIALPLRLGDATGSPVRPIALVPRGGS